MVEHCSVLRSQNIDYIHIDMIKDHLKAKEHVSRKEATLVNTGAFGTASGSRQATLYNGVM